MTTNETLYSYESNGTTNEVKEHSNHHALISNGAELVLIVNMKEGE